MVALNDYIFRLRRILYTVHLNLQTPLPDGRQVWTMIRPGTQPGLLLSMVKELPPSSEENPLSRIHVFSTEDASMSLNMFVFGKEQLAAPENLEMAGMLLRGKEGVHTFVSVLPVDIVLTTWSVVIL